jgi:hypothetical protein
MRHHNSPCTDILAGVSGGLLYLGLFSSTVEISGFAKY